MRMVSISDSSPDRRRHAAWAAGPPGRQARHDLRTHPRSSPPAHCDLHLASIPHVHPRPPRLADRSRRQLVGGGDIRHGPLGFRSSLTLFRPFSRTCRPERPPRTASHSSSAAAPDIPTMPGLSQCAESSGFSSTTATSTLCSDRLMPIHPRAVDERRSENGARRASGRPPPHEISRISQSTHVYFRQRSKISQTMRA